MKKKKLKTFLVYSSVVALLGSAGIIKLCRDSSNEFATKTKNYITEFTDDSFKIVAHRGYTKNSIENTVAAFNDAKEAEFIDYIELDARLSKDNELVVSHNSSVKNDGSSMVIENTSTRDIVNGEWKYYSNHVSSFLKSLFNGNEGLMVREKLHKSFGKDFSIPTLDEAIASCGDKTIILDLKFNNNQAEFYQALAAFLRDRNNHDIILQSADLDALRALQMTFPEYKYSAIIDSEEDFQKCDSFDILGVRKNLVHSPEVELALDNDKEIAIWTIDSVKELDDVVASVGDNMENIAYITNYPEVVATHLNDISVQKKKVTN